MLLEFLPFHIVWTRAKMKKGDLSQNEKKRKQSYKGWELGASQGKSLKAKIEGFISPCPPVFSFFKWKKRYVALKLLYLLKY